MTSPTLVYRELTVNFARSVNVTTQIPVTMQVVLTPLATPTSAVAGGTFVEAPVAREVVLSAVTNSVVFRLVPTDLAGLSARVLYRIAWRAGGAVGRTFTYDFAMPDANLTFEQLNSLNYIIGGEAYLQHTDLGQPGGVARLNDAGQVINAAGTPVATSSAITALEQALTAERVARQSADTQTRSELQTSLGEQANQIINTTNTAVANSRNELITLVTNEVAARQNTDAAVALKADLVSGKIPLAQIPDAARTQGVQVANQAAMLALTTAQVQQFDFAIRPDGVFTLLGTDPSQLGQWSKLNRVSSVNGLDGDVVLNLSQVAAQGGSIAQSQVTDLAGALAAKATNTALTAATGRITAIETDTTLVKTVAGVIPNALNDTRMAYVDVTGQFITRKDGTIISGAGGAVASVNTKVGNVVLTLTDIATAGGSVPQAQVTGLSTSLLGKVDTSDSRLTDTRTPTTHAASHAAGGSDALTLTTAQVTGLATTLTNYSNRLSSLETRITTVEGGGGSGGSGTNVGTLTWFSGTAPTGTFSNLVLHSPFGYNPTNSSANAQGFYYNPAGAAASDARFPYISPNGHLELRKWDETGPADPVYATQSALSALSTTVDTKASTAALALKADASALTALTITAGTTAQYFRGDKTFQTLTQDVVPSGTTNKAFTATEQTKLAGIAAGATVNAADATLLARANHTGTQTVATLSDFTTAVDSRIANVTVLTGKTISGATNTVTNIAQSSVTNLDTALSARELSANKNQPNGYAGLDSSGKLITSAIPALSLTSVTTVTNRAAMTSLTATQVQPGDVCIITATADQGSYILAAADPSVFANWKPLGSPTGGVTSVNGLMGAVTLDAASLGALSAGVNATTGAQIGSIFGLTTALSTKVETSALTTALANRPSWSASAGSPTLETILSATAAAKQRATYVATASVASLNGQQPISNSQGGIEVSAINLALGSVVLLTRQNNDVASPLNGLWRVNSGAWTRVTDMASGSYLVKGTIVAVASGATGANTLWQVTSESGVVDTAGNTWAQIGSIGTAYTPTGGNGITITGTSPSQTFAVRPSPTVNVGTGITADPIRAQSKGIAVDSTGVSVDTAIVARKYVADVPSGSTTPRIYHNLNTRRVLVQVIEVATGIGVLVGWQATNVNYVDLEFSVAPTTGQWAVIVIG